MKLSRALPDWTLEISLESHDERIRRAFGRMYSNEQVEHMVADALEAGVKRLDLFFMVGIKEQTYESVMDSVEYSKKMLAKYASMNEHRVIPFISPMAPFLDPGSRAFEEPEKHGYKLFARTLEEHRKHLLAPSWKYVLNYETKWMNRDQIVTATYEAGRRLNLIKGEYGVIDTKTAEATDKRIARATHLISEIDRIMTITGESERRQKLSELKQQVDNANLSTVCDKSELDVPMRGLKIDVIQAAQIIIGDWWKDLTRPSQP